MPTTLPRRRPYLFLAFALVVTTASSVFAQNGPSADALSQARALASDGRREEALTILRAHLGAQADDTDARVLYGTILSWEGQHDAARRELELVLRRQAGHGDALRALINVELWSKRPRRAEQLAAAALQERPDDPSYLLSHAQALSDLDRGREALADIRRVLDVEPSNERALRLRRGILAALPFWQVGLNVTIDRLDAARSQWQQGDVSLKRQTRVGSIVGRAYRARRGGVDDQQFEVELYPRFRPGSYAYISVAVAPDAAFFPDYRVGFDFWQSLGAGFEGSGGFRRLRFTSDVDIYTATLGIYRGDWYFGGRTYTSPDASGRSISVHGWVRRFLRDADSYVGFRYGRGASREEIRDQNDLALLHSDTFAGELHLPVGERLIAVLRGSVSREERVSDTRLRQYSFTTGLLYRF